MIPIHELNTRNDLSRILLECKSYAQRGNRLAHDAVTLLKRVVVSVTDKLHNEIVNLNSSTYVDNAAAQNLISQLHSIQLNFEMLPQRLVDDIEILSETSFSITVFGRTMAGKSTLMEILTHGKGESIGKGGQRTTRDVRPYSYKGLKIFDVPGIAAFEGEEDEDMAFEAAKKCDLILFLITDDAPQASEAECLNKIISLGKPVICLINIKVNISNPHNLKMFRRDVQKQFDPNRLDSIKKQFFDFGTQYGQDWKTIRFAYVHLKSAFISQQKEFEAISGELYALSQFNYVENLIISEVIKNGCFYKLKAFSDVAVVPIVHALEILFKQSAQNSEQGAILVSKRRKLKEWTDVFETDAKRRIETLLITISSDLYREVASFAEENYDNSNASREWNKVLRTRNVEKHASDLLKQFSKECENKLREISREIDSEIKFSKAVFSDNSINMGSIVDGKRIWNWSTKLVSGGLIIAGLFLSGPVGWAVGIGGAVIGLLGWLGSFLFNDREQKVRDARQNLEKKLIDHIDKMIEGLRKKMLDVLYDDLLKTQMHSMCRTIDDVINAFFVLSETQYTFAVALNSKLKEINTTVVNEALAYLGHTGLDKHTLDIARIPGYAMMILLNDGMRFPERASRDLFYLLKEKVWFIFKKENIKSILSQAIGRGCDRETIRVQNINEAPRIAHIPSLDSVDEGTKNRIRLAQQLTELLIMK